MADPLVLDGVRLIGVVGVVGTAGAVRAGVAREGAAAVRVGGGDHYLDRHRTRRGQDQRRLERQLLDQRAAGLRGRPQGQFHEGGAGQQGDPGDGVVGDPRVGAR